MAQRITDSISYTKTESKDSKYFINAQQLYIFFDYLCTQF